MSDIIENGTGKEIRSELNSQFEALVTSAEITTQTVAALSETISHLSAGIVDQNTGKQFKFWQGSQAQYDALTAKDSSTIYFVQ